MKQQREILDRNEGLLVFDSMLRCFQVIKEVAQSVKIHGLGGIVLMLATFVL